jgi:CheY-like chemotaxis protein
VASNAARDHARRRVLVVDDHAVICEMLTLALDIEGYDVQATYNGWTALELLRHWRPDVILLDLEMPVMDGWAFRRAQLADDELAEIPVVVLSSSLVSGPVAPGVPMADHDQRSTSGMNVAAVLSKPYRLDVLLETVGQLTSPGVAP